MFFFNVMFVLLPDTAVLLGLTEANGLSLGYIRARTE